MQRHSVTSTYVTLAKTSPVGKCTVMEQEAVLSLPVWGGPPSNVHVASCVLMSEQRGSHWPVTENLAPSACPQRP